MADCVAPGCDYARTFKGKRSVFQFPTDPVRLRAWLKSIPRKNFAPTKHSKMCEVHFEERFISRTTSAIRPTERKPKQGSLVQSLQPTPFRHCFRVRFQSPTKMGNCVLYQSTPLPLLWRKENRPICPNHETESWWTVYSNRTNKNRLPLLLPCLFNADGSFVTRPLSEGNKESARCSHTNCF